jgi:hypothetical protein
MRRAFGYLRPLCLSAALAIGLGCPARCLADKSEADSAPSIFRYGFNGFWVGAQLGLAMGYLSTGSEFESGEWKSLVIGAGIGAVSGIGIGITLGVLDSGVASPPGIGFYVLRDVGYGTMLGALGGTAIGAILLLDTGELKTLAVGAAIGALIGAAAGIVLGVIEGENAQARKRTSASGGLRLTLLAVEDSLLPVPGVRASF